MRGLPCKTYVFSCWLAQCARWTANSQFNGATKQGDVYEFNACQSRLIELYDEVEDQGNVEEFTGYRILHSLYSNSMADAAFLMAELTPREREARPIAHALGVPCPTPHTHTHDALVVRRSMVHGVPS